MQHASVYFGIVVFVGGLVAAIKDVQTNRAIADAQTERAKAETALADSAQFGRAILDDKGRVVEWNPALERITGWLQADMVGQTLAHVMLPADYESHSTQYQEILDDIKAGGKKYLNRVLEVDCSVLRKSDLKPLAMNARIYMVKADQGGKPYGIANLNLSSKILDISELDAKGATR